jgi:FlaA1/EpsC-like NDP-sugar epimerase
MRQGPYLGARHQMQAATKGGRVVIVGAGEQAALTFEYFTYDSAHEVIAFSAEPDFITTDLICGLPVVPFDKLAVEYPPTQYQAFVAVSATQLNRVRRRLYGAVKAIGYRCVDTVEVLCLPLTHSFGLGRFRCAIAKGQSIVLQNGLRSAELQKAWSGASASAS